MNFVLWTSILGASLLLLIVFMSRGASRNKAKYRGITFSKEDILAKITSDFPESERAFVIQQLERLGPLGTTELYGGQAQFSALVLAEGNSHSLPKHMELGLIDTRDLIVKAGLG